MASPAETSGDRCRYPVMVLLSPQGVPLDRRRAAHFQPSCTQRPSPTERQLDHIPSEIRQRYAFDVAEVDHVLGRYAVANVPALLEAATRFDDGEGRLGPRELELAANRLIQPLVAGYRYSLRTVDEVLARAKLGSLTALLDQAIRLDGGKGGHLDERLLTRAAAKLRTLVPPNDVPATLKRIDELRTVYGLRSTNLGDVAGVPMEALELPSVGPPKKWICITAGVHGNEPSGVGAALLLIEQLMERPELRRGLEISVIPLVNWRSLAAGTRETLDGRDLNRTFAPGDPDAPLEARLVDAYLEARDFTHGYDLHSGGGSRNGHWILHLGEPALYQKAIRRLGERYPLLRDHTRPYALSEPGLGVSANGDTLKGLFVDRGALTSATLEAPGSISYLD